MADPLILTARFDAETEPAVQRLRDTHFPPALNRVPAHLTLFHHLPGEALAAIAATLRAACDGQAAIGFRPGGLRFLGRGVAIEIEAPALTGLRERLAAGWRASLTPQDRQPFRPHVTIQNKADSAEARALHQRLAGVELLLPGTVVGLDLWHYRGGPWAPADRFRFAG